MNVKYINRSKICGFSIAKVFNTIIAYTSKKCSVKEYYVPCYRAFPLSIFKNLLFSYKLRDLKSIFHISGEIHYVLLSLIGCKTVLTIHDLNFLYIDSRIKRFLKFIFWLYLPVKLSDYVTCISEYTKQDILRRININPNKIVTIYNPLDSGYKYRKKAFNKICPKILHIGTGWNKNLDRTITALNQISCHLIIIGAIDDNTINMLIQNEIKYSNYSNISDDEIREYYEECDIVSFTSIYEGFGMPIIEGQAIGRPVVTSKIEPLLEVAGGGAMFVDPMNCDSIRDGFLKVINDENYRNIIIKEGLENVKRFSVTKIGNDYLKVYNKLLNRQDFI